MLFLEINKLLFKGVSDVIDSGQHNKIQYNNLSILPNAEMANPKYMEDNQIKVVECPISIINGSLEKIFTSLLAKQQLVISTKSLDFDVKFIFFISAGIVIF